MSCVKGALQITKCSCLPTVQQPPQIISQPVIHCRQRYEWRIHLIYIKSRARVMLRLIFLTTLKSVSAVGSTGPRVQLHQQATSGNHLGTCRGDTRWISSKQPFFSGSIADYLNKWWVPSCGENNISPYTRTTARSYKTFKNKKRLQGPLKGSARFTKQESFQSASLNSLLGRGLQFHSISCHRFKQGPGIVPWLTY